MKAGLLCIAALSAVAVAQPHRQHQHHHAKRQDVVTDYDVQTETDVVTATAPNAVVYVDGNGNPIYTSYEGQAASTPTSAPVSSAAAPSSYAAPTSSSAYVAPPPPSSSSVYTPPPAPTSESSSYVAPAPSTTEAPAPSSYAAPSSSAPAPSGSASSSSGSGGLASGHAISYSPYNSDNSCKSQDQVNSDFAMISGYNVVRIYGTDCNQVSTVLSAASAKGMKLFAGVFDITQVSSEVQTIIDAANGNWDNFDTINIGNELVNSGTASASDVVSALGTARSMLKGAGYTGKLVTVDTFVAIIANPELCQASDYAAANCHAFFDGSVAAAQAGEFVLGQAQRVSQACGGMDTVITESGWPWQGETNGAAVPSPENQAAAISSLKSSFSSNLVVFTAFNDYWKQNSASTFGAEQYWGVLGK